VDLVSLDEFGIQASIAQVLRCDLGAVRIVRDRSMCRLVCVLLRRPGSEDLVEVEVESVLGSTRREGVLCGGCPGR